MRTEATRARILTTVVGRVLEDSLCNGDVSATLMFPLDPSFKLEYLTGTDWETLGTTTAEKHG